MRRNDREVTAPARIRAILEECKICRLGLWDGEEPYVVPMSFGYTWEEGLTLYFHCATEGRRMDILKKFPKACFELDCGGQIYGDGDKACTYSCSFSSIIGVGVVEVLCESAEKLVGLEHIMTRQTGQLFTFTQEMAKGVAVLRLRAEQVSCKVHE